MDRFTSLAVLVLCLTVGAHAQLVCWSCYDCTVNKLDFLMCGTPASGGGGTGSANPTLPTSPQPTFPTSTTTVGPQGTWFPPLSSTVRPWGRANGYMCYRNQRYIASQNRYTYDRGCALQLNTYDSTCRSLAGNSGEAYCEFCLESLCNY